ncbi:hypothetical protein ABT174_39100 [Streptomyces sparsogenes]|uniref:hypothetical protein n=1 Tax=Streptomyces sparsogenes TaxID=67365 RepID=UPI0033331157
MSFDEEWSELRSQATQGQKTQMRLNHVDDGSGGQGLPNGGRSTQPDLSVKSDELGRIGHDAFLLYDRIMSDGGWAQMTTLRASVDLAEGHFETAAALSKADEVWHTKLGTLQDACAHISNHLDFSAKSHAKDDAEIAYTMRDVDGDRMTPSKINKYFN